MTPMLLGEVWGSVDNEEGTKPCQHTFTFGTSSTRRPTNRPRGCPGGVAPGLCVACLRR